MSKNVLCSLDNDLISKLSRELIILKKENNLLRKEIEKKRNKENFELEMGGKDEDSIQRLDGITKTNEEIFESLITKNILLEKFIRENGFEVELKIINNNKVILEEKVGEKYNSYSYENDSFKIEKNVARYPKEIDSYTLLKKIEKINLKVIKESKERVTNNIYKKKEVKGNKLIFFRNGLKINEEFFFDYSDSIYRKIITSILDEEMPSFFLNKPELNKEINMSFNMEREFDRKTIEISKEEILNKLPSKYILKGKVVSLKEMMESHFKEN